MLETTNPARAGNAETGSGNVLRDGFDTSENALETLRVQAVIADRKRDFVGEPLRIAEARANHRAENITFDTQIIAKRKIRVATENISKAACPFCEFQKLEAGGVR
ncbi:MAG TPA: hypothetical protein VIE66_11765 [Methylocella sp.]|jgi:hypothetical protein